jgi:hypothetical protein
MVGINCNHLRGRPEAEAGADWSSDGPFSHMFIDVDCVAKQNPIRQRCLFARNLASRSLGDEVGSVRPMAIQIQIHIGLHEFHRQNKSCPASCHILDSRLMVTLSFPPECNFEALDGIIESVSTELVQGAAYSERQATIWS